MERRILIVEDHTESAEGLAQLLALWGYEPHIAAGGEEALTLVAALEPEAVVSDIGLPGIDGHELARRIRGMSGGDGMLLVALTGSSADGTESAFDHRLMKPVDVEALERLLESETRRRRRS